MQYITTIVRSYVLALILAAGSLAQASSMVRTFAKNFTKNLTQQNMARGFKFVKTYAANNKYKVGFGLVAVTVAGTLYRNSRKKAVFAQKNKKGGIKFQGTEYYLKKEASATELFDKRVGVFQDRMEKIEEQVADKIKDYEENDQDLPVNFKQGIEACGFLAKGTVGLSGIGLFKITQSFVKEITQENISARQTLRTFALKYIACLEKLLTSIEQALEPDENGIDRLEAVSVDLIAQYQSLEKERADLMEKLKLSL